MIDKTYSFVKIFEVELNDIRELLILKGEKIEGQYARHEIGEYVYKQNSSLIRHKLMNLKNIENAVSDFDFRQYRSLTDMIFALDKRLIEVSDKYKIANTLRIRLMKKMKKVEAYVNLDK